MALGLLLPVRIAQGVFSIIVLGLSAYVAHWYNNDTLTASPSQINFLIFVPLFSFISLIYLELSPKYMSKVATPIAHLALSLLTTLFYFSAFIALSVFLGKLLFCRGSVCAAARADAAFAAFSWMLWMFSSAVLALEMFCSAPSPASASGKERGGLVGKLGGMFVGRKGGKQETPRPMKEVGVGA